MQDSSSALQAQQLRTLQQEAAILLSLQPPMLRQTKLHLALACTGQQRHYPDLVIEHPEAKPDEPAKDEKDVMPPLMPLLPAGLNAVYLAAKRQEVKEYDARMQVCALSGLLPTAAKLAMMQCLSQQQYAA